MRYHKHKYFQVKITSSAASSISKMRSLLEKTVRVKYLLSSDADSSCDTAELLAGSTSR